MTPALASILERCRTLGLGRADFLLLKQALERPKLSAEEFEVLRKLREKRGTPDE